MVLLNPSGRGVSDEIASALRRDDELIDLKVSRLQEQVNTRATKILWSRFQLYDCSKPNRYLVLVLNREES